MEQIVQQYIQAKGLNEQQAQQLIQELQQLDEQQLQQVIGNMQQQLQENNQQEDVMQYGGNKKSWINSYGYKVEKINENSTKIYSKPNYERTPPPIYVTNPKDPRIGSYTEKGNQILYKAPVLKLKQQLQKNKYLNSELDFNKESETPSSINFEQITLPEEEIYIAPKQKEYTSGQQVYELNDDYLNRLHQENIRGIKQIPKLIRNQYGGIPVSMDGVFEYPNQPVIVPTNNTGEISMENVNSELYGVSKFGIKKMIPNKKYNFNDDKILEFPANYVESKTNNGSMILNHKDINEEFINELKKRGYYVKIIS